MKLKFMVTLEVDGPVSEGYVADSIEFAINHYREAEGLSKDSDEGCVTSVSVEQVER